MAGDNRDILRTMQADKRDILRAMTPATKKATHTIQLDFGKAGLDTSTSRLRAAEDSLWTAENTEVDFRGTLRKSPKMFQMGPLIVEPTGIVDRTTEEISAAIPSDPDSWAVGGAVGDNAIMAVLDTGPFNFYGSTGTLEAVGSQETTFSGGYNTLDGYDGGMTLGFSLNASSLYSNAVTTAADPALHITAAVAEDKLVTFMLTDVGLYYLPKIGQAVLLVGSDGAFTDGLTHNVMISVELTQTPAVFSISLFIDGVAVGTRILAAEVTLWRTTAGESATFRVTNTNTMAADELCAGNIAGVYLRDAATTTPNLASIERVFTRYKYDPEVLDRTLRVYAATKAGLWFDDSQRGMWQYARSMPHDNIFVTDFRDSSIITSYGDVGDTALFRLNNRFEITELTDAPNIRFTATHGNRVWGAGDSKYGLRVYFSGDRDPNLWFAPETDADGQETIDEVLGAGYFEMDSNSGDYVTCLHGDYNGNLIVGTKDNKLFRIYGNSFETWQVEKISDSVGAFGPDCMALVGVDLWIVGSKGISSLQAVQAYGDMATTFVSAPIRGVFTDVGARPVSIVPQLSEHTALVYDGDHDTAYLMLRKTEGYDDEIWSLRLGTKQWLGPWLGDVTTATYGVAGTPQKNTLVTGSTAGEVRFRVSVQDTTTTTVIESQVLSGRSLSPKVPAMEKGWRNLRVLMNPTGYFPVVFEYKVEDGPWKTITKYLARKVADTIGTDWTVGTSTVGSQESLHVIDFPLKIKGKTLKFRLTTAASKASFIAAELEFTIAGFVKGE